MGVQDGDELPVGDWQFDFENRTFKAEIAFDRVPPNAGQSITSSSAEAVPGKDYKLCSRGSENLRVRHELRSPIIGRDVILHRFGKGAAQQGQLIQVTGSAS